MLEVEELISYLVKKSKLILTSTLIAAVLASLYALQLPNEFQSRAIFLIPEADSVSSQNYGLSSLIGFSNNTQSEKGTRLLLTIDSQDFTRDLFSDEEFKAKYIQYSGIDAEPNPQKLHDSFTSRFKIDYKDQSYYISTFRLQSQDQANVIHDHILNHLDTFLKTKYTFEIEQKLDSIKSLIEKETLIDIRLSLTTLYKNNIQKILFTESNNFYVLNFMEKPTYPSKRHSPKRSILVIVTSFIVFIIVTSLYTVNLFIRKIRIQSS